MLLDSTEATATLFHALGQAATQGATRNAVQPFARDSLSELLDLRTRWRVSSVFDPLGMFLLQRVAGEEGGVSLDEAAANLRGPDGWLALARLIRAGFLDENGRILYVTPSGRRAAEATATLVPGADGQV